MNEETIEVQARVLRLVDGSYTAETTSGREDLVGLYAFGTTPTAARRALFDVLAEAATAAGAPPAAPETVIAITIPEVYHRRLGVAAAGA